MDLWLRRKRLRMNMKRRTKVGIRTGCDGWGRGEGRGQIVYMGVWAEVGWARLVTVSAQWFI